MADVARAGLVLVPRIDGLEATIRKQLGAAESSAGRSGEAVGRGVASGMGKGLASSGAAIGVFSALTSRAMSSVSAHVGDAVSRFDTLNNYPKTMETLGYSAEGARASIDKMSGRLSSLPTRLDDMVGTVQGIVAITGDLEKATDAGLALNDMLVASGSSQQLVTAAMEQFRQMLAKGKPEMEDWRSLTSAAPGQMAQLAKAMLGPTATANDLYAALGGGKSDPIFTMDQLMDAMVRLDNEGGENITSFREQAETGAAGVSTAMSNMGNAVTKGIASTMDAVGKDNIIGVINDAKDGIKDAFSTFNGFVGDAAPTLKALYDGLRPIAPQIVTTAAAFAAFSSAGGGVASFVSGARDRFAELAKQCEKTGKSATMLQGANALLGTSFTPLGLAITAVSAVAAVGVSSYIDWKRHTDALSKATQGLYDVVFDTSALTSYSDVIDEVGGRSQYSAMSLDELLDSMGRHVDKMRETTEAAEAQVAQLNTAQGILHQSVGVTDLSSEAQGKLTWALQLLNDQLGTSITQQDVLNGTYTDSDGNIRNLLPTIDELIAKKKEEAKVSALTSNLTEAYSAQREAASSLAKAQQDYNDKLNEYLDAGYSADEATVLASTYMGRTGQNLKELQSTYDSATKAVSDLNGELGNAASAASESADAFDAWASDVGPLFEQQLAAGGKSLSGLKDDLRLLGTSADDLRAKVGPDQLTELALAYDGTTASIVGRLAEWGVQMDATAQASATAAAGMRDTLSQFAQDAGDSLSGVDLSSFSDQLADAGVSTETLNAIGSENFAALAQACGGNVDAMVWFIQNYNATPIIDKDGNVNVDAIQLIDAQGRVYTWNGSYLADKDGNVAVEDTQLTDAQGNLWTWNNTGLHTYDGSVTITEHGVQGALRDRDNWNAGSWVDHFASATVNVVRNIASVFTGGSGNAAGGIRTHADGGIVTRLHASGAIATRAVPLDIVGEAGAEAIVPLTNKRYSQPFANVIADSLIERLAKGKSGDTYYITMDNATLNADSEVRQTVRKMLVEFRRIASMG